MKSLKRKLSKAIGVIIVVLAMLTIFFSIVDLIFTFRKEEEVKINTNEMMIYCKSSPELGILRSIAKTNNYEVIAFKENNVSKGIAILDKRTGKFIDCKIDR